MTVTGVRDNKQPDELEAGEGVYLTPWYDHLKTIPYVSLEPHQLKLQRVNDIGENVNSTELHMYADDTLVFSFTSKVEKD